MGEKSTSNVYSAKYKDGSVRFEVIDHDITDVYPDSMIVPIRYMPAYLRTEYLFPKKKKRGTARRKRRMKRYKQSFINFMNAKYGSGLI